MMGYYSVFNPRGEKIADCGIERDAVNLMHSRNKNWDGHYFQYNPLPGVIVDVEPAKQLPTHDIVVVEKDVEHIEVGGQKIPIQQLTESKTIPFITNLHD